MEIQLRTNTELQSGMEIDLNFRGWQFPALCLQYCETTKEAIVKIDSDYEERFNTEVINKGLALISNNRYTFFEK